MRSRRFMFILLCLLCGAGTWLLWHHGRSSAERHVIAPSAVATRSAPTPSPGVINTNATQISLVEWNTNKFAGRLSNTTKSLDQLLHDDGAIVLENALIDTRVPLDFVFPKNLQPQGDPGAYIVQARGPIDNAFRALLAQSGATVVSYIPNNAYLVRASSGVAGILESSPPVQAVVPYEPYYKIQSPLLWQAVGQVTLPDQTVLNLGLFADTAPPTLIQITKLGGQIIGQEQSPFGPVVRVIPPRNWTALAVLPGVQIVEPFYRRAVANDLARATNGVAANSLTATNYMNLTGSNIIVEVNDTGIDAQHPDLTASAAYGRAIGVIGDAPQSLVDTNGHGTHVAGIIAGDGLESPTVTNAPGSTLVGGKGSAGQFRGMAPGATLYSAADIEGGVDTNDGGVFPDQYLQEVPALTNALISNNSWVYEGNSAYDLAAASYDAAVRDALPAVTGSQPVLFVFAAGNAGNGSDGSDFGGGIPDSIESPATAKNVITVGAIQEDRNITNSVTNATGQISAPWQPETSTSYRVAGFSSRGNVGIGTEGTFGRFKPDVVAPGTFIISTRSEQWDINSYFYQSPTNDQVQTFTGVSVSPGSIYKRPFPSVPTNAVELSIALFPNANSPFLYPSTPIPILMGLMNASTYPFLSTLNPVVIPGDPGAPTLAQILSTEGFLGGFNYAISNNTPGSIVFDLQTDILTTNGTGNYFLVLSNLNNSIGTPDPGSTGPGPYYRYESGTSMSTPMVSGMLALLQQYYANAYGGARPSPALLKAMVINGARAGGFYDFNAQNSINLEGWGLINLPNSLPPGMTNQLSQACSDFIQDQNSTNALATGDSQTFLVATTNAQPLRVTLAWTDPPGDPAAAIKLVNNLVVVVTNLSNPTNLVIYYGNDIPASSTFNSARSTNTAPVIDSINNIQNVYLPTGAGTNFSVTVMGYRVNVNAVTAQTNNVVQDYALVISCGNGQLPSVMKVTTTPASSVSNPTGDQDITYLSATNNNNPLLNQTVGANTPLLGTNTLPFAVAAPEAFGSNWQVTVGMTNQWHFYVITNTFGSTNSAYTNAAFITFIPDTLSVPRMGVFGGSVANATRPEADIDLYVSTDPTLTNLNPVAISNAVVGTQVGATTAGPTFMGASLSRGGTEFVVDTNSQANQVYYIGVKSEDQMASEYGFISIFSQIPFSQLQPNGSQVVTGLPVPVNIPDGSPVHPGKAYVFGLAIYPVTVGLVTAGDTIQHQNYGDLIGTLTLNGGQPDVLNNHDSLHNGPGFYYTNNYDDSGSGSIPGSRPSDGPGSLNNFAGHQGLGVWMLTEVDDSLTQTGTLQNFNLTIQPHQNLQTGITATVPAQGWFYDFIDVPPGTTNLTIIATNFQNTATPPLELFDKFGELPTLTTFDASNLVDNATPPPPAVWGAITNGPPLVSGRYWVGIYNPSPTAQTNVYLIAILGLGVAPQTIYSSGGPVPILDDAVTTNDIVVPDNQTISSMEVALRVDHPRISDLVFHLIGPDGTRDLLVENRGGNTANMGATLTASNGVVQPQTFSGGSETSTNVIDTGQNSGTLNISYNFFTLPDELAVYDGGVQIFDSGLVSGSGVFNIPYTGTSSQLTFVMNPFGNPGGPGDAWTFTVNSIGAAYTYLVLTEDTNKTTTPIKFAVPPFVPGASGSNAVTSGFESATPGDYTNGTSINDGTTTWTVLNNQVTVVNDPATTTGGGTNFLALANGIVSTTVPTVAGRTYALTFRYRGPAADGWWRGENNTVDSIYGNNGTFTNGANYVAGEVGTSFDMNGVNSYVLVNPITPYWNFGQTDGFTIEGWINPTSTAANHVIVEFDRILGSSSGADVSIDFSIDSGGPGTIDANIKDIVGGNHVFHTASVVTPNVWQHVAMTYNDTSGIATCYYNGSSVLQTNYGPFIPGTSFTNMLIGARTFFVNPNLVFPGGIDELSMYDRPLSDSEVQAIFQKGIAGKFDATEFSASPPTSLAEAQVSVNGGTSATFFGNNTNWQTKTIIFKATQAATPLQLTGVEPGMLLDSFSLSQVGGDLYYLPEQSLDAYDGLNASGPWSLEIQDNRVGATNPAPMLLSWQLRFNYVTTGTSSSGTPPGITTTNIIPPGGIAYYPVNVPTNADAATNILVFANAPLNIWFNQTNNPVGANPPDVLLLGGVTNGTAVLTLTSVPPLLPGQTYFIGLQNTNTVPVTNGFLVNFHLILPPPLLTNNVPSTNSVPSNSFAYFRVTVPTNANAATNLLLFSSLPVNVWFNQTNTPVGTNPPDYLLIPNATSGTSTLTAGTTPPLVPGSTYYLGVQNTNGVTVNFALQVNFQLIPPSGIVSGPTVAVTNNGGTNGILLTWFALTNYQYQIQWTTTLSPPVPWTTIPGVVLTNLAVPLPVNGIGEFQYFDDGTLTGGFGTVKFYRLIAYPPGVPIPPALVLSHVVVSPGGLQVQWHGSTNYIYNVLWTTNLTLPTASWNVLTNLAMPVPLSYSGGVFTFTATNALTGGSAPAEFFQVQLWP